MSLVPVPGLTRSYVKGLLDRVFTTHPVHARSKRSVRWDRMDALKELASIKGHDDLVLEGLRDATRDPDWPLARLAARRLAELTQTQPSLTRAGIRAAFPMPPCPLCERPR